MFIEKELLGETIRVVGEVIVAAMVIGVHHRVKHEHRIDQAVFKIMQMEQVVGIFGIALILSGYLIEHWL